MQRLIAFSINRNIVEEHLDNLGALFIILSLKLRIHLDFCTGIS